MQSSKALVAEEDMVAVHSRAKPSPAAPGMAVVAIFRVADGKIVEHWDVNTTVSGNPIV
ncbi:MAG: nuclear transport factor 2 family protein [Bacteroidota bacterium]